MRRFMSLITERFYAGAGLLDYIAWSEYTPPDDRVYRITISDVTKGVRVSCLGIDAVDSELEGTYVDSSALPDWVQRKLAVLYMMDPDGPVQEVIGIGVRLSPNVFWIYANDTRQTKE